jgi:AsmA protein
MRWILGGVAAVFVAVGLAVVGVMLIPREKIAQVAADQLKAATGRDVTISGVSDVSIWPNIGVTTGPVTIANATWAGPEPFFTANGLEIAVSTRALLMGRIDVRRIAADSAEVRLQQHSDGRGNWAFAPTTSKVASVDAGQLADTSELADTSGVADTAEVAGTTQQPSPTNTGSVSLNEIELTNAFFEYRAAQGPAMQLRDVGVLFGSLSRQGSSNIVVTGKLTNEPLRLAARVDGVNDFLAGEIVGVAAKLNTAGGGAVFDGSLSLAGFVDGILSLNMVDSDRFASAFGVGPSAQTIAGGQAPRPIQGTMRVQVDSGADVRIDDILLAVGTDDVSGRLKIDLGGERPVVTGAVTMDQVNLPQLLKASPPTTAPKTTSGASANAGSDGGGNPVAGGGKPTGWSTETIDMSALRFVDANVEFDTGPVILSKTAQLDSVSGRVAINNGRAEIDLDHVRGFDGWIAGQLVANARNGFSTRVNLTATDVNLAKVQNAFVGPPRGTGILNGQIEVLGIGTSLHDLMNSLDGQGQLNVENGGIIGVDLLQVVQGKVRSGGTTVFDRAAATFELRTGVLHNRDLQVDHRNYGAFGDGRIGLGARDIDYTVAVQLNGAAIGTADLRVPVRFRGPWAAMTIAPDLEALAKGRAEQAAREQLGNALGSEPTDSRSLREQVKDRLESEAGNRLLNLLGGN